MWDANSDLLRLQALFFLSTHFDSVQATKMFKVFTVHSKIYFGRRINLRAKSRASKETFQGGLHIHRGNGKFTLGLGSQGSCYWGCNSETKPELGVSLTGFLSRCPGNLKVGGEVLQKNES